LSGAEFTQSPIHRLGFCRPQVSSDRFLYDGIQIAGLVVWETNVTVGRVCTGGSSFESIPLVSIVSDELVKHSSRTISNGGVMHTINSSILQTIPVSIGVYSYIHYHGFDRVSEHRLDGRTIADFDIEIQDHNHKHFQHHEFKDYNLVLLFTTEDESDAGNQAAVVAYHELGFRRRHNCSR